MATLSPQGLLAMAQVLPSQEVGKVARLNLVRRVWITRFDIETEIVALADRCVTLISFNISCHCSPHIFDQTLLSCTICIQEASHFLSMLSPPWPSHQSFHCSGCPFLCFLGPSQRVTVKYSRCPCQFNQFIN